MPTPEDPNTPPPLWSLQVFDRAGQVLVHIFKPVNGPLVTEGDHSYIPEGIAKFLDLPRILYPALVPPPTIPAYN